MSAERRVNFVSQELTQDGYGYSCKKLVDCIVACDNIFSIAQVDSESSSEYKVWLRIYDTNMYLYVSNNSASVSAKPYCGILGTVLSATGTITSTSFFNRSSGSVGAVISRIGDFMFTVVLQSSVCPQSVRVAFALGTSEYNGEKYCLSGANRVEYPLGSYDGCVSAFDINEAKIANLNTGVVANTFTGLSSTVTTACTTPTGAVGVLNPWAYSGYTATPSMWMGHIKWGGNYDLYKLYSPSGVYGVDPNGEYSIDGTTYKGTFTALYIPVECS